MTIAGNLTENSDRRLKTNIQNLGSVLGDLAEIDPVRFRFKEDTGHPEDRQIGLIAQEVQENFPELVTKGADGYLSLAYPKLTAVLLKGLQEQQSTVEEVKQENEEIKRRLAALEMKITRSEPAEAALMDSWMLIFALGLGLGTGIGLLLHRRSN